MREKLIELLCQAMILFDKRKDEKGINPFAMFADHLIANGVTVQKWISVEDRLPEEEGLYLVAVVNDHERRYSKTAWYHGHGNWFVHQKVTHWQYLPQPPKGE